jgi:tripartite-type tricarboxylate transporter receptor subunit TctC
VAAQIAAITSVPDVIKFAKATPNKLRYASPGNGGIPTKAMELVKFSTGIQLIQVPYKGSLAAIIDVMSGQVELLFTGITRMSQHIKSGRLRGVAISAKMRSPLLPETPTVAESGFPDYQAASWYGVLAKSGTPMAIQVKLGDEVRRILALPAIRQKIGD